MKLASVDGNTNKEKPVRGDSRYTPLRTMLLHEEPPWSSGGIKRLCNQQPREWEQELAATIKLKQWSSTLVEWTTRVWSYYTTDTIIDESIEKYFEENSMGVRFYVRSKLNIMSSTSLQLCGPRDRYAREINWEDLIPVLTRGNPFGR